MRMIIQWATIDHKLLVVHESYLRPKGLVPTQFNVQTAINECADTNQWTCCAGKQAALR